MLGVFKHRQKLDSINGRQLKQWKFGLIRGVVASNGEFW